MSIQDGGYAFPVWELNGQGVAEMTGFGMKLRDYFAAKAMQAALSEMWTQSRDSGEQYESIPGTAAKFAYEAADAMLAARQGGGE